MTARTAPAPSLLTRLDGIIAAHVDVEADAAEISASEQIGVAANSSRWEGVDDTRAQIAANAVALLADVRPVLAARWHLLITDYHEVTASHLFDTEDAATRAAADITRESLLANTDAVGQYGADYITEDPTGVWKDGEGADVLISAVSDYVAATVTA